MNNNVYEIDFTRALPSHLRSDENMLALGRAIATELQENIKLARVAIIYPRIDELDENTLDILANDLHIDWYDDSYPIEAKRSTIKNSVKVHKRLGTKYAVVTALGSIFPSSEVEEWFEYGGTHHRFRIILDLTNAKAPANVREILQATEFYKRLTAHLDEVIFQMSTVVEILIEAAAYHYNIGLTGQYNTGTHPRRNTGGGIANPEIEIETQGKGDPYKSPLVGTIPERSTMAALRDDEIEVETSAEKFSQRAGATGRYKAGETPRRNTGGGIANPEIEIETQGEGDPYKSPLVGTIPERSTMAALRDDEIEVETSAEKFSQRAGATGRYKAGEAPRRNTGGAVTEAEIEAVTSAQHFELKATATGQKKSGEIPHRNTGGGAADGAIEITAENESWSYESPLIGTQPARNKIYLNYDNNVSVESSGEAFLYSVDMTGEVDAGTSPHENTGGGNAGGGIIPTVTAEAFPYRVKRCGTSRCKKK